MEWLKGKKTYICCVLAAVVIGVKAAKAAGLLPSLAGITDEQFDMITNYLLGANGVAAVAALRAGGRK